MKRTKYDIEDFILDDDLKRIVEEKDEQALDEYKKRFGGNLHIDEACLLLQHLKINEVPFHEQLVDRKYQELRLRAKKTSKVKYSLWLSGVACAFVLFILSLSTMDVVTHDKTELLATLDTLSTNEKSILVVSGENQAKVADNTVIEHSQEGSIIVGGKEKINSENIREQFIQLVVPKGKRTSVRFSDGTLVWVNSGSKLLYPKTFEKGKREIFVEGEIYLDVSKGNPFWVHTKAFDVSVLGTQFNVNAYNESTEKSVVLVRGSVEVKVGNDKTKLLPKQGMFLTDSSPYVKEVDTDTYTCWKDGTMKIAGETLQNIFMRLSDYYGVSIDCEDSVVAGERYRGKLNLRDSVEQVLYNLSLSTPFSYEKSNENIITIK